MTVPNWLRIVLLLLTFASFLPQLRLLWTRRDSSGISLWHVLFNLAVATELFTLSFFFVVNSRIEGSSVFVHDPPDTGDHINLAHFALVWLLWLVIFTACLVYPSNPDVGQRALVSAIYVAFLLISVVPVFVDAAINDPYTSGHKWGLALAQTHAITVRPPGSGPGALSLLGLAVQAVVFALLAPAWLGRLVFPWEELGDVPLSLRVLIWFQVVGYVPFDYALFAVSQAVLLWLAVRHGRRRSPPDTPAGETDLLLGAEDGKMIGRVVV
ncbi:hypothetical protein C8A00DRAFT_42259 [Chaetomidium leptoderma]|uniref:Uncharacterized protein n=1 Tax=Chaetomidium leptoderma TaxID=669021 RepID=A0AAN6VRI2_9PEZI|nr:hypothetical protein C8A00DRAFT_42259 [Chaetomidium leptoderma]